MITRLEVDGFKSLRNFAVDLDPLTVFIGPNSAGKSNVLEALGLLSRLASMPIAEAFKGGRGRPSDQFTRMGSETAHAMRFAVEFLFYGEYVPGRAPRPTSPSRCRYELTIERQMLTSGTERLVARHERVRVIGSTEDAWLQARPNFLAYAGVAQTSADLLISSNPSRTIAHRIVGAPAYDRDESVIASSRTMISLNENHPSIAGIHGELQSYRWLRIGTTQLGEPSDRIGSGQLAADASNLPTVLAELPPAIRGEIRADLVALVPGVASFEVVAEGDEMRIDFELSGGDRMPARLISDGTLRILVLLTALRIEPRPSLLCIEEPENGIYPGRLRVLLDLFEAEARRRHDDPDSLARLDDEIRAAGAVGFSLNLLPTQILLTTHSPVILAALRERPEHLRFVDAVRRDGHRVTRVRTVASARAGGAVDHRLTVSPREIDLLLDTANSEEPA